MVLNNCELCNKRRKRYRPAFNSWICDNCKHETIDYSQPDALIRIQVREWINSLSFEKKLEMYLKDKQNKEDLAKVI